MYIRKIDGALLPSRQNSALHDIFMDVTDHLTNNKFSKTNPDLKIMIL